MAALCAHKIEVWYWQRQLPGWSPDAVPQTAQLRQSLLLVSIPRRRAETERLLDILETLDLLPWNRHPVTCAGRNHYLALNDSDGRFF